MEIIIIWKIRTEEYNTVGGNEHFNSRRMNWKNRELSKERQRERDGWDI